MNYAEQYRRRANECFAFAKSARNEEERLQLLIMANTLERLAVDRERKAITTRKTVALAPPPHAD
jgi:hypothetical protein